MTDEQVSDLCESILRIAHGPGEYASGFESLVMAICGPASDGRHPGEVRPLVDSLDRIATGLESIAAAITDHAEAIRERGER